jgi:hypothetical protein
MGKLKNDNRKYKLVNFDGEGIGQKERKKITIQKGIKEKKSRVLHKVSSFNDDGGLNSTSAQDGSLFNMQYR